MIDKIWDMLLAMIGDLEDDSDIDERLKICEREKIKQDLKGLRRR